MADTAPTAGLRFEITGDNGQLKASLAEIEKVQAKTAESLAKNYESAGAAIMAMAAKIRDTWKQVDGAITTAMNGGAEGVETAVVSAFEKSEDFVKKSLDTMAQAVISKMGVIGKGIALIWPTITKEIGGYLDSLKTTVANKLDDVLKSDTAKAASEMLAKSAANSVTRLENVKQAAVDAWKSSTGFFDGVKSAASSAVSSAASPVEDDLEKMSDAAKKAADRINNAFDGLKNGVEVAAGIRMAAAEFAKILAPLDQMIAKQKEANELIGKTGAARARILAKRAVEAVGADGEMSDEQTAEVTKREDNYAKEAQRGEDLQKGIRQEEQTRRILASVKEQADLEAARSKEMGKTAGEMARMQAEARATLSLTKADVTLNAEKRKLLDEQLDRVEREAKARAAANTLRQVNEGGQNELNQIQLRTEALGLSSGAQAEAAFSAKAYADSIKQVGYVTEDVIAATKKWAPAIRQATDAQEAMKRSFQQVQDAGNVVAKGLESAFAKWTTGAKLDVKEMVSSMLADMAQLAFKNSVSQLLFGSSGSVNNGGGLFGSLATSLFKREGGGPVTAGQPYIVGEKRPEVFVPKTSGYILPEVPQGRGGGSSVSMPISIDMRGATVDAVAVLRAQMPGMMAKWYSDARQRGAFA